MEAVILAGGLGTRLKKRVPNLPKALAMIGGVPFLDRLLETLLASQVISKVVLSVGHKKECLIDYYKNSSWPLVFSAEKTQLGTGGALKHALPHVLGDTILVLNGDSWIDLDYSAFIEQKDHPMTLACVKMKETKRYGQVGFDKKSKKITHFKEKGQQEGPGWINGGVYLIKRALIETFPQKVPLSLENEVFPLLLQNHLFAYPVEGRFFDIGTTESYNEVNRWY